MATILSSELGELAFRVVEAGGPNAWLVIVAAGDHVRLAVALAAEIADLGDERANVVSILSPDELATVCRQQKEGILIVTGAGSFSDDDWRRVDLNRSRYLRDGTSVLATDEAGVGRIEGEAPNFASWIAGNIWRLGDPIPLDQMSLERRLVELRAWSGKDDTEVIRLAENGTLPRDPSYAEWVALLGRGDLLVR